jgi:hypothetical protein
MLARVGASPPDGQPADPPPPARSRGVIARQVTGVTANAVQAPPFPIAEPESEQIGLSLRWAAAYRSCSVPTSGAEP